jgi:hypothetical protein
MTINLKALIAAVLVASVAAPAWAIPVEPDGNVAPFASNGFTFTGGQLISDTSNILPAAEVTYLTTSALLGYSNPLTITLDAAMADPLFLVVWNRSTSAATIEGDPFNANGPKLITPTMINSTTYTVGTLDSSFEFGITGYRFGRTNPLQYFAAPEEPTPPSNAVPEPATAALVGLGALGLLARRRRLAA